MSGKLLDLQHLCRYRWHVEDVRSWLLAPSHGGLKALSMPVSPERKPAGKSLPQLPLGKSPRPQLTGDTSR